MFRPCAHCSELLCRCSRFLPERKAKSDVTDNLLPPSTLHLAGYGAHSYRTTKLLLLGHQGRMSGKELTANLFRNYNRLRGTRIARGRRLSRNGTRSLFAVHRTKLSALAKDLLSTDWYSFVE